ncbi:unnamed protein product [Didymodactylos carnosus]|uniref:Uncharacterized protein n=1 Tax=Didymodactylos carnosus TaxID=1234261 RepID=A0A815BTA3_9BILA|nr:unnamed protein product [Didymodactylos carnosus]CAF1277800.1 unnamed protein product [Didymodactylos carnosus]CAF3758965.1 unnamed protein product [Didymodactylos carnosus]CAF4070895.1 unnamed protein product [Didymodactylos carnosus]
MWTAALFVFLMISCQLSDGGRLRRRRQMGYQNQGWANTYNRYPYSNQYYGSSIYGQGQYGNNPYGGSYGQSNNYGYPYNNAYGSGYNYNGYYRNDNGYLKSNALLSYILLLIPVLMVKI